MTAPPAPFLAALKEAADGAAAAEAQFRREAQSRIATLEAERAFAFRRLNLMRTIVDAATGAESEEIAVANALAALRTKLGWHNDSEARTEVVSRFAAVARSVHARLSPREEGEPEPDVTRTLADFEAWYARTRTTPFWALFEHHIPETPLIDF
jgi:hypothetical protein